MKIFKQNSDSIKHKMEEEPPDIENDKRNGNNICIRNSRRYISDALLSIRWKTAGPACVINDNFHNFVELLYN